MTDPAAGSLRNQERFIRSFDGTQLFTESSGSGAPIVLCDGLGCDGFVWRHLRPGLEQGYQVVHWHYRGHGLSQTPPSLDAIGVRELVLDLLAVLDAHELDKVVLVGHSLGVQVILEFALRHRDRVAGVVTVCGSYGTPLETFHNRGHLALIFPTLTGLVSRYPREAQRLWTGFVSSELAYQAGLRTEVNGALVCRQDFEPYFTHLASMDIEVFMALVEDANHHSVESELDDLVPPTLVIAGTRDTFTPAWLSERMVQLIPGAELLMVPGGTHVAPIEIPELIALRLERFLARRAFPRTDGKPARRRRAARSESSGRTKKAKSPARTKKAAAASAAETQPAEASEAAEPV